MESLGHVVLGHTVGEDSFIGVSVHVEGVDGVGELPEEVVVAFAGEGCGFVDQEEGDFFLIRSEVVN